jgi:serine/threonine protein kinase
MYTYMKKFQKFIDYSVLKELSIRLVLILEKIHSKNIIYRSLRPENILFVDNEG